MTKERRELRDLLGSVLRDGMTAQQATDAVLTLVYEVETEEEQYRLHAFENNRATVRTLTHRWLVARIPRGSDG